MNVNKQNIYLTTNQFPVRINNNNKYYSICDEPAETAE